MLILFTRMIRSRTLSISMTGEIVQDDIILDSGSITDVLNSRDAFFDYIFGTENH